MRFLPHVLKRLAVALGAAVLVTGSTVAAAQVEPELPDIGEPAGALISDDYAYAISLEVLRELRAQNYLLDDPESNEYIQDIGARLASQAPDMPHPIQYVVAHDDVINSDSIGDLVIMWSGLIIATENESELAGVMAHETAHCTQRHLARGALAQEHQTMAAAATMLAAVILGVVAGGYQSGDIIEGGLLSAQGMAAQQGINYTRTQEWEADHVGLQYLAKAGFSPYGMADFFELLQSRYGFEESLYPKFLQDHPITPDRIADARDRAAQLPQPTNLHDSVNYGLIRERLRVLTSDPTYDILDYYRKRMESDTPSLDDLYGYAVALMQRNQPAQAVRVLKPLVAQHQAVVLLRSALGQAQVAAGETQQGLATFAEGETLFPRNVPLTVRYAEALIKSGRGAQAHNLLLDLFNNVEPTPMQIKLTAQAASAAGDPGDAYYYMGEYQISTGNLPLATQQLQLALATPHLNNVQRERYRARLAEIREFLAQQQREKRGGGGGSQFLGDSTGSGLNFLPR